MLRAERLRDSERLLRATDPIGLFDSGVGGLSVLRKVYRQLLDYRLSGNFQQVTGSSGLRVLIVAPTKRLARLLGTATEAGAKSLFWFAPHRDNDTLLVTAETILEPIWTVPGQRGKQRLLDL